MSRALVLALLLVAGCGYKAKGNEMVGQVKKVVENTPIICGDYTEADVSLGVMRGGTGSMSREDVELSVDDAADIALLKQAAESGRPVKITYDIKRASICKPDYRLTHAELLVEETQ